MDQNEFVAEDFSRVFSWVGDRPIALYGVGAVSKLIIERAKGFNIIGLMDRVDGGIIGTVKYGLPVLTKEEAAKQAKIIVITARQAYVPEIYRRIAYLGMPVYDAGGNLLMEMPEIIESLFELGYYAYGPLTAALLKWIKDEAQGGTVLFGSRDGYLLSRLYDGNGSYFLTSRRVLVDKEALPGYREYVRSFYLPAGRLFFFDLITSGTIPSLLPSVLKRDIECLCGVMIRPEKVAEYKSCLGTVDAYDQLPNLYRTHYLAESIFTAPHPEIAFFGSDGSPVYCTYRDSHSKWESVSEVHRGITAYVNSWKGMATPSLTAADSLNGIALARVRKSLKQNFLISDHYRGMGEINPWEAMF